MAAETPVRRVRRIAWKAGIAAIAPLTGLLLAESGLRLWMRVQGDPFDALESRIRMRTLLSPIARFVPANVGIDLPDGSRRPILRPFYGSEDQHDTGAVFEHFREDARPDDYEILLVGGSVAAFLASRTATKCRPSSSNTSNCAEGAWCC